MNVTRPLLIVGLGTAYVGWRRGWFARFQPQIDRARARLMKKVTRVRNDVAARLSTR